ncbi:MAG: hypothetical protein WCO54_04635 [Bacteroidota bacterium]
MNKEIILSGAQSIQKYFDNEIKCNNYDELLNWLTEQVVYLMLNDMEKLLGVLYRIDVNEKKVKQAFAQTQPQKIAPLIAELILQRELQKAESRLKYKQ